MSSFFHLHKEVIVKILTLILLVIVIYAGYAIYTNRLESDYEKVKKGFFSLITKVKSFFNKK